MIDSALYPIVLEEHKPVDDISDGQDEALVPLNEPVPGHGRQHGDSDGKDEAIPGQRVPQQLDWLSRGNSGARSHSEGVEEERAYNSTQSQL